MLSLTQAVIIAIVLGQPIAQVGASQPAPTQVAERSDGCLLRVTLGVQRDVYTVGGSAVQTYLTFRDARLLACDGLTSIPPGAGITTTCTAIIPPGLLRLEPGAEVVVRARSNSPEIWNDPTGLWYLTIETQIDGASTERELALSCSRQLESAGIAAGPRGAGIGGRSAREPRPRPPRRAPNSPETTKSPPTQPGTARPTTTEPEFRFRRTSADKPEPEIWFGDPAGFRDLFGPVPLVFPVSTGHVRRTKGPSHRRLASGDVNSDGVPDVVTIGRDNIVILLGGGRGWVSSMTEMGLGRQPATIAVGEFNSDGLTDLVVVAEGPGVEGREILVLTGDGSGKFQIASSHACPQGSHATAAGDVTGDGRDDLLIGLWPEHGQKSSGVVRVFEGNGHGGFVRGEDHEMDGLPVDIAVADVNGDGLGDFAVVNHVSRSVSIMSATDAGGFIRSDIEVGQSDRRLPRSVAFWDFNADSKPDLAVGIELQGGTGGAVAVLEGDGSGWFSLVASPGVGFSPSGMAVADLDGDGLDELAVPGRWRVSVLAWDAEAGFEETGSVAAFGCDQLVAGDFDSDGSTDLAGRCGVGVVFLPGDGAGDLAAPTDVAAGHLSRDFTIADFNADGVPDLAALELGVSDPGSRIHLLAGEGDGRFRDAGHFEAGRGPIRMRAADLNGDDAMDLVTANYEGSTVNVFWGDEQCRLTRATSLEWPCRPTAIDTADFDGDGRQDIAISTGFCDGEGTPGLVSLLSSDGQGGFTSLAEWSVRPSPSLLAAGDFNSDDVPDLIISAYKTPSSRNLVLLLSERPGNTYRRIEIPEVRGSSCMTVGDVDNDGNLDLVLDRGGPRIWSHGIAALLGDGEGGFAEAPRTPTGRLKPIRSAIGDLNLDGALDVAVAMNRLIVGVFLGNGTGGFHLAGAFPTAGFVRSVAIEDLNGDELPDLAIGNSPGKGTSFLRIYFNRLARDPVGVPESRAEKRSQ